MYQYPYGNAQQLNLDWILSKIQELESGSGGGGADLEEVANALISASFDAGVSYRRYDYCFYNGKLYRALNDTSGAFNPADWLEVVIGDDIPVLTRLLNAVDTSLTSLQTTVGNQGNDITNLQNALGDLDSDDVDNASLVVSGDTVTDALNTLDGAITTEATARSNADTAINNTITDIQTKQIAPAAYIEQGSSASRNYNTGDYLIWNNILYRVTTPISAGATLISGTNIQYTFLTIELTPITIAKTGSLQLNDNNDTLSETRFVQRGRVCEVHFYVSRTGGFTANTLVELGTISGIAIPPTNIRTIQGCGNAAYNPTAIAYITLSSQGAIYLNPTINCTTILFDLIYTID